MVSVLRHLLIAVLLVACAGVHWLQAEKFYPDDPINSLPKPLPITDIKERKINALYDFIWNSVRPDPRAKVPGEGVNTLGEVPDNAWFTNRHARKQMSREELKRGPGTGNRPIPPFVVVAAKTEGISPGFRIQDSKGRIYFVKPDPVSNPELATSAELIGSKFFYALGYNTPEDYLVNIDRAQLSVGDRTRVEVAGRSRPMTDKDIQIILEKSARGKDGSYRVLASLALEGELVGPFSYEGTRRDDPNDIVPHERRRDLRGLHVFCAWLNHTDSKSGNTLSSLVEEGGIRFLRHYLIDFGAILGSDSDRAKDARFGNGYVFPEPRDALAAIATLGFYSPAWERANYPENRAIGRFESELFDPEKWKSNYPNPAFLSRQPDDEYWAAKQVMAFTDDDIGALVETGEHSDPAVTDYVTKTLCARRDKIGKTYFAKVLPLDHFAVSGGTLLFEDLAVKYGFAPPRQYQPSWTHFNNRTEEHVQFPAATSLDLPNELQNADEGSYFAVKIHAAGDARRSVTVYLRKKAGSAEVVGIDRSW